MTYVPNELLSRLVGLRLYSVVFVMDYGQLMFDGSRFSEVPTLGCFVWPSLVLVDDHRKRFGDAGYRDALCALIGSEVVATTETVGDGFTVSFEQGTLVVRPTSEEVVGPEIAQLSGFEDRSWMVWRPGEDSFEYLH
jgi:hypothetical protein